MREVPCPVCDGARLKPEVLAVRVGGLSIAERLPRCRCARPATFLAGLELGERERAIAGQVLKEIQARLGFLLDVGSGLPLARPPGGHALRRRGAADPPRDADRLGAGRRAVRPRRAAASACTSATTGGSSTRSRGCGTSGNTLIVVEHDEDTIRTADWIVDIGPGAGEHGGRVVHSGDLAGLLASPESVTGAYLSGRREIPMPAVRRPSTRARRLTVVGAREHNLQRHRRRRSRSGCFVAVTGVSGSGKSTLVNSILYTVLANELNGARQVPGRHTRVTGLDHLDKVVHVDQGPDRPHAAVEPGDLHRGLGPRPPAVRRDDRGEGPRLHARAASRSTSRAAAARPARATARSRSR